MFFFKETAKHYGALNWLLIFFFFIKYKNIMESQILYYIDKGMFLYV